VFLVSNVSRKKEEEMASFEGLSIGRTIASCLGRLFDGKNDPNHDDEPWRLSAALLKVNTIEHSNILLLYPFIPFIVHSPSTSTTSFH
jgi:hypothetical protein